jgi:peptidoglycan-associated lipoprotein
MTKRAKATGAIIVLLLTSGVACLKRTAVLPPPIAPKQEVAEAPKPKPNPPTITTFTADPSTLERGQSATLHWVVKDATDIEIDQGVGSVSAVGQREISPTDATTYTIRAIGPGGEVNATTTLAVSLPPPPPAAPKPAAPLPTISERLSKEVQDVYFNFDKSDIRADARATLTSDADALKSILSDFPTYTVILEGHCDQRGSAEYNLALGDRRAKATKAFLGQLGVAAQRLEVISYGKEKPQCTTSDKGCWQRNRRVHFAAGEDQGHKQVSQAADLSGGLVRP